MTIPLPSTSSAIPPFRRASALASLRSPPIPAALTIMMTRRRHRRQLLRCRRSTSVRRSEPGPRNRTDNFYLAGERGLAKGWQQRARDSIAAVRVAAQIAAEQRAATIEEQRQLIRFTGFGATELANGVFRRPGETEFAKGWDAIGADLQDAVDDADYASLARCTQYAHFTPEFIVRAIWAALLRLGWRGGRVLEPGIGTGLFPALMPEALRHVSHVTGIELDPVTARIARLLQPRARIVTGDFARIDLPARFDLAIGNPPFSDRTVRSDRALRSQGLRLHDFFLVRAIKLLKPGGLAAFVTSHGTMDKADGSARELIAKHADLVAAIRLPEGSFRADAGTDVVVDILFLRRRKHGESEGDLSWLDVEEVRPATDDEGAIRVNRWFARHPRLVLGAHALTSGPFGETYTCLPKAGEDLALVLAEAITLLPDALYDGEPEAIDPDGEDEAVPAKSYSTASLTAREGSYLLDHRHGLMQILDGEPVAVTVRRGRSAEGIPEKHVRIIQKLIPIRDAVREVLKCQELDRPWKDAQVRLRIAWSNFVRAFGPINTTVVSTTEDPETGEVRETHRRPNLQPFLDDPDCWLVASIEDYDLEIRHGEAGPHLHRTGDRPAGAARHHQRGRCARRRAQRARPCRSRSHRRTRASRWGRRHRRARHRHLPRSGRWVVADRRRLSLRRRPIEARGGGGRGRARPRI